MRAIYRGVDLMPLRTHEFKITPVYDPSETDYLYSRVTLLVESIASGESEVVTGQAPGPTISYARGGPGASETTLGGAAGIPVGIRPPVSFVPGPFPPNNSGIDVGVATSDTVMIQRVPNTPPLTHITIRERLSQPQGQLYIFNGPGMEIGTPLPGTSDPPNPTFAEVLVQSPLDGAIVDCNNGPKPHLFNVISDNGDGSSYIVIWGVETFINEAGYNGIQPSSALLSNRFSQSHHVDEEGFTTIVTEGTAIFRTDSIYFASLSPDSLRASLFMPIPQFFERVIDDVQGLESAVGVNYRYTDTQVKSNFVAGPYVQAASINALHRQAVTTDQDLFGGALDVYERHLQRQANRAVRDQAEAERKRRVNPGDPGASRLLVPGGPKRKK